VVEVKTCLDVNKTKT